MEITKNLYDNLKMARTYFKIFKHSANIDDVSRDNLSFGKYNKIWKMNSGLTIFAYETFEAIISKEEVDEFLVECERLNRASSTGYTIDNKHFKFIDPLLDYVVEKYNEQFNED